MTSQVFSDAADYTEASCGPELPRDTAEDVFLDARCRINLLPELTRYRKEINQWSLKVFREFWSDYETQEGGGHSSRTFGDEAAIRLLQTLTGSKNRRTAMRAECYLAVINRKNESQTDIARKYDVTKAAVSKIIVGIRDELCLPTARHMKSESARQSYRERALRIHKQNKQICKPNKSNSFSRLSTLRSALMQTLAPQN